MNIYNVHLHLHKLENTFTQIIQMPERACALELYDLQKDPGEKHNLLKVTFSPNCCFHAFLRSSQMPGAPWLPTSKPAWWKSFQRWQRQLTRTRFLLPRLFKMVHCPPGGVKSDGTFSQMTTYSIQDVFVQNGSMAIGTWLANHEKVGSEEKCWLKIIR